MNSYYVFSPGWTWHNYLQARSFETSLKGSVSKSSGEIIASNEQLHHAHIDVLESLNSSVAAGFEEVCWRLSDVADSIQEVNATLDWGFSSILLSIGKIGNSLEELKRTASTPAQTWAQEQFVEARRAFERGWHNESLVYVQRSLYGHGSNTGYDLNFRSHFLLGLILLGNAKNNLLEIINLESSEASFLASARYAEPDEPNEAARGMLCAGWAAYCQGGFQRSLDHTYKALRLDQKLAEGYFQVAKVMMNQNCPDEAIPHLQYAIYLDRNYMPRAAIDDDFKKHQSRIIPLFDSMRNEASKQSKGNLDLIQSKFQNLISINFGGYRPHKYSDGIIQTASKKLEEAKHEFCANTYFGYLNADRACALVEAAIRQVFETYKISALGDLSRRIDGAEDKLKALDITEAVIGACMISGLIIFLVAIIGFIVASPASHNGEVVIDCIIGAPLLGIIGGLVAGTIIGLIWHLSTQASLNDEIRQYRALSSKIDSLKTNL